MSHLNSAVEIIPYYLIERVDVLSSNTKGGILFEIILRRNNDERVPIVREYDIPKSERNESFDQKNKLKLKQ